MYLMPTGMWLAWEEKGKIKSVGVCNDLENDHFDFQTAEIHILTEKTTFLTLATIFLI